MCSQQNRPHAAEIGVAFRASIFFLMIVACSAGDKQRSSCGGAEPEVPLGTAPLDIAGLEAAAERRFEQVLERPAVNKGMDEFVAAVLADPALQSSGKRLLDTLAADPKISKAWEAFTDKLGESPEVQNLVRELMKKYPGKTPDEMGEIASERVGRAFDNPVVDKALDAAIEALFVKVHQPLDKLENFGNLSGRIRDYLGEPARTKKLVKRLTELNGGQIPSAARVGDLYLEHVFTAPRLEKFACTLLTDRTFRAETAKLIDKAIEVPAVKAELHRSAAEIAGDATVQDAAGRVIVLLLAAKPKEKAIGAEMHRLLCAPVVVKSANRLAKVILTDAKVREIAVKQFDKIAAEPGLRKACDELFQNW